MKKILLVDDYVIGAEGLASFLRANAYQVSIAGSNSAALGALEAQPSDLVCIDFTLAGGSGDELVREIRYRWPTTRVLAYSRMNDNYSVLRIAEAGVHGFVSKSASGDEVLSAVRNLLHERSYFDAHTRGFIVNRVLQSEEEQDLYFGSFSFSPTEVRIIRLTVQELHAREIGEKLYLSDRTIEQYRQRIMKKMGVKTIVGLVKFALKHGIVSLSELWAMK